MKATISQIKKAISYDNEMLKNSPKQDILYFISKKQRKERILTNIGSTVFYDFCKRKDAYGCFEIYELLLNKKIPKEIVKFFVDTNNGGCYQLDIIFFKYGIGNSTHRTLEEVKNDMLELYKGDALKIGRIFNGHAIKPTLSNILHDLSINGESSTFYKQLSV